jgi:hypothetical protein
MENLQATENIFAISIEDLQFEAKEKLRRELTEEEILVAKKGLENGLLTSIDIVYSTIFSEMIK